jgi:hypothetical protein
MSSNPPAGGSNQNRLYTRFITILKIIQFIGFFLTALFLIVFFSFFGQNLIIAGPFGIVFLGYLIYGVITCISIISIYVFTQVLIAIIDLLSRIERNTRP